jgi:hypothetical protein
MLSRYGVINPLSPLWALSSNRLESSMNRLFQDFETAFSRPVLTQNVRRSGPRVQLQDRGDAVAVFADLPGSKLEDGCGWVSSPCGARGAPRPSAGLSSCPTRSTLPPRRPRSNRAA